MMPSFEDLIFKQVSSGYWDSDEETGNTLRKYFKDFALSDVAVLNILGKQQLDQNDFDRIYHTLLALYILKTVFATRTAELSLITKKAALALEKMGL